MGLGYVQPSGMVWYSRTSPQVQRLDTGGRKLTTESPPGETRSARSQWGTPRLERQGAEQVAGLASSGHQHACGQELPHLASRLALPVSPCLRGVASFSPEPRAS